MALSDCVDCWDTPCTCSTGWKHMTIEQLEEHINMITKIIEEKEAEYDN